MPLEGNPTITEVMFLHDVFAHMVDGPRADAYMQQALFEALVPDVTFDLSSHQQQHRREGRLLLSVETDILLRSVFENLRVRDAADFVRDCLRVYDLEGFKPVLSTLIGLDLTFIRRLSDLQSQPVLVRLLLALAGAVLLSRRPGQWEIDAVQAAFSLSLLREHYVCQQLFKRALNVWSSDRDMQLEQQRRTLVQAVAQLREAMAGAGPRSARLLHAQVVELQDQLHRRTAEFRARIQHLVTQMTELFLVADTLGQVVPDA
jgi:hypothetical protein